MIERVLIDPPALAEPLSRALDPELRAIPLAPAEAAPPVVPVFLTNLERWGDPAWDPGRFDWTLGDLAWTRPVWLRVRVHVREGPERLAELLARALTRLQRYIERRNVDSRGPVFERILRRHRALHDRRLPLVRADHDHAVDTWRWTLRLRPEASLGLQVAALFHDVERLGSEARERREHRAADYEAFKRAHARAGAEVTRRALRSAGVDEATIARVTALVAEHERPADGAADPEERAVLSDADALSFFSLNASGFLDYDGPAHTRTKIAYTLGRLRPEHHDRLRRMHIRSDVLALLAERRGGAGGGTARRSA